MKHSSTLFFFGLELLLKGGHRACCQAVARVMRAARLPLPIAVRFHSDVLHEVQRRSEAGDRWVASWIRGAGGHELNRTA